MSNEPKKSIDIDTEKSRQVDRPTDINKKEYVKICPEVYNSSILINRKHRFQEKALTITDIQDEEDIYERIKIKQRHTKLRINKKEGRKKKKRKLIQYDYGKEYEDINASNKPISQLLDSRLQVNYVNGGKDSKRMSDVASYPFTIFDYNESTESKQQICTLILENFHRLNLIELFNNEANPLLQLHLFHIYIYSIVYDQDVPFMEANNGLFDSVTFQKILSKLLMVNEINHNHNAKFTLGNNLVTETKCMKERTIEKIETPSIILRRLDIPNQIQ